MKQFRFVVPGHSTQIVKGEALQLIAKENEAIAIIVDEKKEYVACVGLGPGVSVIEVQQPE